MQLFVGMDVALQKTSLFMDATKRDLSECPTEIYAGDALIYQGENLKWKNTKNPMSYRCKPLFVMLNAGLQHGTEGSGSRRLKLYHDIGSTCMIRSTLLPYDCLSTSFLEFYAFSPPSFLYISPLFNCPLLPYP